MGGFEDNAFPVLKNGIGLTNASPKQSGGVFDCVQDGSLQVTYNDGTIKTINVVATGAYNLKYSRGVDWVQILSGEFNKA